MIPQQSQLPLIQILGLMLDSTAIVAVKDLEHRYIFANRALEQLLGASRGELIGTSNEKWMSKENARIFSLLDKLVSETGKAETGIHKFNPGDDTSWSITVFSYGNEDGKALGIGMVGFPVTDRAAANQSAYDVISSADRNYRQLQAAIEKSMPAVGKDSLTGVWNRIRIEKALKDEIARSLRLGHKTSLIFMDIDGLQSINDAHGIAAGDAILREFAEVTRSSLRSTDQVGRWGGEEFFLLLPNTPVTGARMVAERIRKLVNGRDFAGGIKVTASSGVAACQEKDSIEAWIARATHALAMAKGNGKNCVEVDPAEGLIFDDGTSEASPGFVRLIWRKRYEGGDSMTDRRYRELFEQANQILAGFLVNRPPAEISADIKKAIDTVKRHFAEDEARFAAAGLYLADAHKRLHAELINQLEALFERHAHTRVGLGEIFNFIAYQVIAKHILTEDSKYEWPARKEKPGGAARPRRNAAATAH